MADIMQTTFSNALQEKKYSFFYTKFAGFCSHGSNEHQVGIVSGNGLLLNKQLP